MKKQTVASVIVTMLEAIGVERAFVVSGESYLPLLDGLAQSSKIDVVTCRHEGGAGLMAVADAKLSGIVGVCMVSRSPGAANAALGLVTAREDAVPIILFVGQVETFMLRRGAFQEINVEKFFNGTIKWAAELSDAQRIVDILHRAIHTARNGTPGPVVISLPEDVLAVEVDADIPVLHPLSPASPLDESLDDIVALLSKAQRPLFIVGGELANPRGRAAIFNAAEAFGVPVLTSFRRLDLFPNAHQLFAGELGFFNTPAQLAVLKESDLIIAVGTRLGDLTTQGYTFPDFVRSGQKLVHVHRDPEALGLNYAPEISIACDTRVFLEHLIARRAPKTSAHNNRWALELHEIRGNITKWIPTIAADGVVFGNVIAELGQYIQDDAIVALDAGVSAAMMYRYYPFKRGQILLTPITGSMGFGIPAAKINSTSAN
jgi:acetolactate synthase I/II/III large subunit